jgi:hypothetical protein
MNRISPANMSERPSSRKLSCRPISGTQGQALITVWPANTAGACTSSSASADTVTRPAATAVRERDFEPSQAVATVPSSRGSKTINKSTVLPSGERAF